MENLNKLEKLPKEFTQKLPKFLSENEIKTLIKGYSTKKRNPSFRINWLKWKRDAVIQEFIDNGIRIKEIVYLKEAFEVLNAWEDRIEKLECYKSWKIYLQSPASQIPALILNPKEWEKILDLTAAPWGKTTQMADLMNNKWNIIANEINQKRAERLQKNIKKQGVRNVTYTSFDATKISKEFKEETFDKILIDAPCSWEGRFNLNKGESYSHWSENFVKKLYNVQKYMIKESVPLLKNGGEIVYSTCTLSPEENEAIVHLVLSNFKNLEISEIEMKIPDSIDWNYKYGEKVFRKDVLKAKKLIPSEKNEWFFVAKFKKVA